MSRIFMQYWLFFSCRDASRCAMLSCRFLSSSAFFWFVTASSSASFASRSLRCSKAASFLAAAKACSWLNCWRKDSMWSNINMFLACSFFILFCVRKSSDCSQASIFSCFSLNWAARWEAFSLRYSCLRSSLAALSDAISWICLSRSERYSRSACLILSTRCAIASSRLDSTFCSSFFFAAKSACIASSSSFLRNLASSNFLAMAAFFWAAASTSSWIAAKSRFLRSSSRILILSSRFFSFSSYRFCLSSVMCFCISAFSLRSARSSSMRCFLDCALSSSSFRFSCNSATKALRFFSLFIAMFAARFSSSFSAS
mmetsp:Transcript_38721/g.97328  ORF Transcript_38721/g.97328 Transcript_38721/m.97328 type:complete len:314 (-) Transcript_38721:544-1485(-)